MSDVKVKDPAPAFCFKVECTVDNLGEGQAFFRSCGGLKIETEVVDYKAGGVNNSTYKLVGATKFANITLKRGYAGGDDAMIKWRQGWVDGTARTRATVKITQLDTSLRTPLAIWQVIEAWPCKYEQSELDASKNEIIIETLELAHHGLKKIQ
jgi:phage tail-like protein